VESALVATHSAAPSSSASKVTLNVEIVNRRSSPFVHWLSHSGVPLARPGILLLTITALLLNTLGYLGFLLADDTLLKHLPNLTPEGRALMRQSGIHHGIFIACVLMGGQFCLAKGWRYSTRLWLLILIFVALSDFWRVMSQAVSVIVSLVLGKPLGEIPTQEWAPLLPYLLIAGTFLILSLMLFLPPVNRWRKAMRELANISR
jgi:hypothetical protein